MASRSPAVVEVS